MRDYGNIDLSDYVQTSKNGLDTPTIEKLKQAKKIYIFGDNILYFVPHDETEDVICASLGGGWWHRNQNSFWDSWDFDPLLFLHVEIDEALQTLKEWNILFLDD